MLPFVAIALLVDVCGAQIIIADLSLSRMVELNTDSPHCRVYDDQEVIRHKYEVYRVTRMPEATVTKIADMCRKGATRNGFVYPGTKWCGPGTTARNYSDLGYHSEEDRCCRQHDNCPLALGAGRCRGGLCNRSPFTRSHCDCDALFRRCLRQLDTYTAHTIGAIYFNVAQVYCFREKKGSCDEYRSFPGNAFDCPLEYVKSERYHSNRIAPTYSNRFEQMTQELFLRMFNHKLELFSYMFVNPSDD